MNSRAVLALVCMLSTIISDTLVVRIPYEKVDEALVVSLGIGENKENFKLAVSTTESISWIHSKDCLNCGEVLFKESEGDVNNKTLRFLDSNDTASTEPSGKSNGKYYFGGSLSSVNTNKTVQVEAVDGSLEGKLYSEQVFIDSTDGTDFFFVGTTKVKDWSSLFRFDGVLGLSYKNINGGNYDFLLSLMKNKKITKRIFSIGNGELYIGEYPIEVIQFPSNYTSCNITTTEGLEEEYRDGYVCDISHIALGNNKNFSETEEIQGRAIFDSAFGKVIAPIEFLPLFKEKYFSKLSNCSVFELDEEDNDYTYISCQQQATETLEEISLVFGGYGLIIPGRKLFTKTENDRMLFNIIFNDDDKNFWRIGRLVLDEYLTVYDSEMESVGFYGENKKNYYREWIKWWNLGFGTITSQEHFKYLVIASIVLGSALLLVVICLIIQSFRSNKDNERGPLQEDSNDN